VIVMAWAGACSSPSGPPADLSATGKARVAEYCAKRQSCAAELNMPDVTCPTSACLAGEVYEAPLLQFFDCQTPKQCSAFFSDDACFAAAGTPDAEQTAFVSRCIAKNTECSGDFAEFCGVGGMAIIRKEWLHKFDACIGMACADIDACLAAIELNDCWKS